MRSKTFLCLMIAVSAGCVSSRPVRYYSIEPAAPAPSPAKPDGPTLVVGAIVTPEALQDARIRYRAASHEAGGYEYHRWTERPASIVRNSLVRALRASGDYARVLEASSSAGGDYLLRGKLFEFDEVDGAGIQTRVSLYLELVDRKTNKTIWDRAVDRDEPVEAKNVPDVVQSLDRNLRQVVTLAVAEIGKAAVANR
jgi:ABC-type uncharacterized transport system auxiliary subunit